MGVSYTLVELWKNDKAHTENVGHWWDLNIKGVIPYVRFAFANPHLPVLYAIYVIYIICLAINELPYVLDDQTTASLKSHCRILKVVSMKTAIL